MTEGKIIEAYLDFVSLLSLATLFSCDFNQSLNRGFLEDISVRYMSGRRDAHHLPRALSPSLFLRSPVLGGRGGGRGEDDVEGGGRVRRTTCMPKHL